MTRRMLFTLAAAALVMLGVGQPAFAQDQFDFKVPFNFVANGKAFTAGNYTLVPNEARDVFTLESKDVKGGGVLLGVETRVAERRSLAEPELVFDKLDGKLLVSELLVPGEDGYLLLITKAKHTHESLKGTRTKK
jgi:hypothetical protein